MKHQSGSIGKAAILTALAITAISSRANPAFAAGSASVWSSTRPADVNDPANNMRAFTIQVPAGWKFTGMIARPGGCHAPRVAAEGLAFTALSPDGITSWEKLPGMSWAWASDGTNPGNPKCKPVKIATAAEFLLNIAIPNLRPDAKNIHVIPVDPKVQQAMEAANQRFQSQATAQSRQMVDSARVRLQYTLKGKQVEELIGTVISCQEQDFPAYPAMHRAAMSRHLCGATGIQIRRAPQGALDAFLANDPPPPAIEQQWDAYIQQNMRTQFAAWKEANDKQFQAIQDHYKQVTAGMLDRGRQFQQQQKTSFDNAMAQDRATQGAIDHAAQMQVRDSLNRADFIDPNTGRKIETSNQFGHNWISSDGQSVVLNSDTTFDPNGVIDPVRQSWTELIPIN